MDSFVTAHRESCVIVGQDERTDCLVSSKNPVRIRSIFKSITFGIYISLCMATEFPDGPTGSYSEPGLGSNQKYFWILFALRTTA